MLDEEGAEHRPMIAATPKTPSEAKRDRVILLTLLFHALRRDELCKLKVKDSGRHGAPHLNVSGKGEKTGIRRSLGLRSAPTCCSRRPPPTRSTTKPTLPRSRNGNGSATPTSPPPASTITARRARRTAQRSR